ncbi:MAG: hypothetical protein ABI866_05340 [Dokdonella sp.]
MNTSLPPLAGIKQGSPMATSSQISRLRGLMGKPIASAALDL